jgi:hypothetical protein
MGENAVSLSINGCLRIGTGKSMALAFKCCLVFVCIECIFVNFHREDGLTFGGAVVSALVGSSGEVLLES